MRPIIALFFVALMATAASAAPTDAEIKQAIAAGEVDLAIGTHALIEEDVKFPRLGFSAVVAIGANKIAPSAIEIRTS